MPMKIAFSSWNNRIAPVFDVARQIILMEVESGRVTSKTEAELPIDNPGEKAQRLAWLGVNTLVCGAVSRFMHELISSHGITVIPFIAGDLQEVIRAWEEKRLDETSFAMPGCCTRLRRRSGCMAGSREWGLYICPGCGQERRYKKDIAGMGSVCPKCGSILRKRNE